MSVKVHEAFSLDSFQDRLLFFDDFHGDQIQDEWDVSGTGAVIDQQTGGIVRLTTTAVNGNNSHIDWNNIRSLLTSKKVTMEVRTKINTTANIHPTLQLRFDASNKIMFDYDTNTGDATWYIATENGGAPTEVDSLIAPDTDYHIYRIECFPTGEVHFYIDGVECGNSPITTNIPTGYLQPFLFVQTREAVAKTMDIDYAYARQER